MNILDSIGDKLNPFSFYSQNLIDKNGIYLALLYKLLHENQIIYSNRKTHFFQQKKVRFLSIPNDNITIFT
ncbi:hypothetical protein J18TS1_07670 [Oceanobacillus oncorhynchi subsp. incaldanensis]|nr:hypothetical protein J18TS1_07670 [Oceanobacillus oncorhynchi subsp. incaldanensis]